MARRPSLIKAKAKTQKKTKTEQYIINHRGFGEEYTFTSKPLTPNISKYFNWYNAMCDVKEAKEYLTTYLKNAGRDADVKKLRSVPDKWLHTTVCWIARMRSLGAVLHVETINFFEDRLSVMLNRDYTKRDDITEATVENPTPKPAVKQVTVADRVAVQANNLICELEEKLDEFLGVWNASDFDMYTWLQSNEVSGVNAKRIFDYYNPQLLEVEAAFEGDKDILEGYAGYSKEQLKKLFGFLVVIVEDTERFLDNTKKVRKQRVAKPMSVDKKLKDFKHMVFDNTRKIQSVQPVRLLSATELWAFNTKYNQLTVLRAPEGQVLDVHRTAITNFDPLKSKTKKLKANAVTAVLNEVLNGGKVTLRSLIDTVKGSDQKLQERMNENTLLLRIVSK